MSLQLKHLLQNENQAREILSQAKILDWIKSLADLLKIGSYKIKDSDRILKSYWSLLQAICHSHEILSLCAKSCSEQSGVWEVQLELRYGSLHLVWLILFGHFIWLSGRWELQAEVRTSAEWIEHGRLRIVDMGHKDSFRL